MTAEIFEKLQSSGKVLIFGYGVTGRALQKFFEQRKFPYLIFEDQNQVEVNGKFCLGCFHSVDDVPWEDYREDLILIPSPGISWAHPLFAKANELEIPLLGELELASRYLSGNLIGVTGTNGKSTTVKLIEEFLKASGKSVGLFGNYGEPLIAAVMRDPLDYYVIEESSYQLELVGSVKHEIAVCLNVTEDHLDRYDSFQSYVQAKANVVKNSESNDWFVFNYDDPNCLRMSMSANVKALPYSLVQRFDEGAFVDESQLVCRISGVEFKMPLSDVLLAGLHNQENILAALAVCLLIDGSEESQQAYKRVLKTFAGLPHRLQFVAEHKGVRFFDDSKATNVGAVVMALASFEKDIVLLAGGVDKQGDYAPLNGLVQNKVKRMVVFGQAKERLKQAFSALTDVVVVDGMEQAVNEALKVSCEGGVVLLAPACASFDQYENYKERGDHFQACVRSQIG